MRLRLAVLMFGLILVGAGCSGLQARGPMVATIDEKAAIADVQIIVLDKGEMTEEQARQALAENAATFQLYREAKTLNLFAYLFSDKTILVNATYSQLLDRTSILAATTLAISPSQDGIWVKATAKKQARVVLDVKAAKDGKESAP